MSSIKNLFNTKKDPVLSIYFTAGFPELDDTLSILKSLEAHGVDLVEIGMPFSDPLADGPVIQASSQQALKNGMSLKKLFEQLSDCRKEVQMPIVLMGYLNPVLQFGMENFLKACQETGVNGLILPDLPVEEYEKDYQDLFEKYGIDIIFLVTPETTKKRLETIDRLTSGFIYAVSSSSTTGKDQNWNLQEAYFQKLEDAQLSRPVLVGFGIKDKASFQAASKYTQGAIIGTAFIRAIQEKGKLEENIQKFVRKILA